MQNLFYKVQIFFFKYFKYNILNNNKFRKKISLGNNETFIFTFSTIYKFIF
jgi:hypothetical protein